MKSNDLSPFGALLKEFRVRSHLTQQQLADRLGIRRNTIGTWERGDFLPRSRGVLLELARCLRLDDQETRRLLEASLTGLAPYWLVPLPRNPFFTGRAEVLATLHVQPGTEQKVAFTQSFALHGLGGVGKTQIALEYAYRHALEYSAVFWIGAETEEQIVFDLLRIADVLQLPGRDEKNQQRVVAEVQQWLTVHGQWLLIWDNLEDLTLLDRFLPSVRQGAILITTRHRVLGTLTRGIDLSPMEQAEAVLFLLRRAKVLEPDAGGEQVRQHATQMPASYAAVMELVTALGGLPLAIDQAGAYLEETQCGFPAYLELFRKRHAALLQQRGKGTHFHPEPVSTTFTLAIAKTVEHHPAAWDLLRVCALLQPDAIPEELFRLGAEQLGATLAEVCRDDLHWNQVIASACSYSLLHRQPEVRMLSLHRLVQTVLLDAMGEEEGDRWTRRVIEALSTIFPEVPTTERTVWERCERLLPHALLCLQRVDVDGETLAFASLAYKVARHLHERGRYAEAEELMLRSLHCRKQALGEDDSSVADVLSALAGSYFYQGKYQEAEPLYQQALDIWERALGSQHPLVAQALNGLAGTYWSQSKLTEAEPLLLRSLHISEQLFGSNDLTVARSLNNLAKLYGTQSRYSEAEPLLQRALSLNEQISGPDSPQVAYSLNNLAEIYVEQARYAEAEPFYWRALQIREQTLGPDHPQVAYSLNNLAKMCTEQTRYEEAELLYQRALQCLEQSVGSDHPDTATTLYGLANLYRDQEKYAEAERFYQRARAIRERFLSLRHPEIAEILHDLAILRSRQGRQAEAIALSERALQIRLQSLGDAHLKTIETCTLHTQLLQA